MRFFIDGEWDGFKGQLLSLALVPEDERAGPYLYLEFEHGLIQEPWVAENVMPHMLGGNLVTREQGQRALEGFLTFWGNGIHVVADWPEDIERFCEFLIVGPGQRINMPRMTFEVIPGLNAVDLYSETPHNALEDAKAIRAAVLGMEALAGEGS